jgi:hypothetical protein
MSGPKDIRVENKVELSLRNIKFLRQKLYEKTI